MGFWFTFLMFVGTTIAGALLAPRPRDTARQASGLGDFQLPTAEEGRPVPVFCGTVKLKGPNVVWYGDLAVREVKQKVKTSLFTSKRITVGHAYHLGMELVFAASGDAEFVRLEWDDRVPEYEAFDLGNQVTRIVVSDPSFWGDPEREGGLGGDIDLYLGGSTHASNDYLESVLGEERPPYHGFVRAVFRQFYIGNSDRMRPLALVLRRLPNQLGLTDGDHDIDGDANPAAWIYELITDVRWGLGISAPLLEASTFRAVGATLASEGLGISQLIDSHVTGWDAVQDVLRHIDGVLFTDLATGRIHLALARDDYDPEAILQLGPSNVESVELTRGSWAETSNDVRVSYLDREANFTQKVIAQQNLAHITASGGRRTETVSFFGLSNAAAANLTCSRVLKTMSYPLAQVVVYANRQARVLKPGSVARLTWPPLGIDGMVVRVTNLRPGTLGDGRVRFDAVEDIFSIAATAYDTPPPSGWTPAVLEPQPVTRQRLEEVPYQLTEQPGRQVMVLAERSGGGDVGAEIWTDPAGGTDWDLTEDMPGFTPVGLLEADYGPVAAAIDEEGFVVQLGRDLSQLENETEAAMLRGDVLLLIDDELFGWQGVEALGGGRYRITGVAHGLYDTVPAKHEAGAVVWFVSNGAGLTQADPYGSDVTVAARLLPYNARGQVLDIDEATTVDVTLDRRFERPYPPGNLRVNGSRYPASIPGGATLTLQWAHRDRTAQAARDVVLQTAGSVGPEAGVVYNLRIYGEEDELLHEELALDADGFEFSDEGAAGDSIVVAASNDGTNRIARSLDGGETWESATTAVGISVRALAYSPSQDLLVGCGEHAHIVWSADRGETWTQRNNELPSTRLGWTKIIWVPELQRWFAGNNGTAFQPSTGQFAYSDNGLDWTALNLGGDPRMRGLVYAPELELLIAGWSQDTSPYMGFRWSDDAGETWNVASITGGTVASQPNPQVAWSPKLGLAVCVAGRGSSYSPRLFTSTDGKNWTNEGAIAGLSVSDNVWYDGLIWAPVNELFVWVSSGGTGRLGRSSDGTTWDITQPFNAITDARAVRELASGRLVVSGHNGLVEYSDDGGETWTSAGAMPNSNIWWALAEVPPIASGLAGRYRVNLEAERDGLLSRQAHDVEVRRHGFGYNFGLFWGGGA